MVCVRGGIFVCVGLPGFTVAVLVADGNRFVAVRVAVATLVALATRVAVFRGGVIFDFVAEGLMNLVGVLDASTSLVGVRVLVKIANLVGVCVFVRVRVGTLGVLVAGKGVLVDVNTGPAVPTIANT